MGFQYVQKPMILNGRNAYTIIGKQKVICYVCNVRLMLVSIIYLFHQRWSITYSNEDILQGNLLLKQLECY